jgi:excisionase family DNA binding protein
MKSSVKTHKHCGQNQRDETRAHTAGASPTVDRLVYTIVEAGRLLGLGRNGSYEAARRGDIPTIRIGRRLLVPKAMLHRALDLRLRVEGTPHDRPSSSQP